MITEQLIDRNKITRIIQNQLKISLIITIKISNLTKVIKKIVISIMQLI